MLYANQKYDIYMSSEKVGFRKLNILQEIEIVGKQCPDDSDQDLKANSQEWLRKLLLKLL